MKHCPIARLLPVAVALALSLPVLAQQAAPDAARIKGLFDTANNAAREKAYDKARTGYAGILGDPAVTLNQRVDALNRTADTWRQEKAYDKARAEYAKILALPGLGPQQRVDGVKSMADAWRQEKAYGKARAEYARILALPDISVQLRFDALRLTAEAWSAEGKTTEARKVCEEALKLPDCPENQRRSLMEAMAGSYLIDGDVTKAIATLAAMPTPGHSDIYGRIDQLAAKKLAARDFADAFSGYVYLAAATNLDVRRRSAALKGLVKARAGVKDPAQRSQGAQVIGQTLRYLADLPATSPKDKLLYKIQLAAVPGLGGDLTGTEKALDDVLKSAGDISTPEQLAIVQNANILFMSAREYDVAKVLKARADALIESSRAPNVYTCRFLAEVPKGAGAWAQSDFVKDPANANTRFFAYPGSEEEKLIADMGAVRPLAEKDPAVAKGREMALYMAYDTYGWHIFIRSDEPDIEQIMREDGRRGSTLEMYFAPGLKGENYYQWLVTLAQGKVDIYHWNTPHRFYRYLENKVGSLQSETAVLKTGWGSCITIAWEAIYDKLPFTEGNEDTWRFSTMRWGPVSLTWGGSVHEPGRWGMVKWQPPTPAQLTEIERNIVRKAWWRYQSRKGQLTEFWKSARGDQAFYDGVLVPFFAKQDAFKEKMEQVTQWDAQTVADCFASQVPLWMELDYLVEEWRADFINRSVFAE